MNWSNQMKRLSPLLSLSLAMLLAGGCATSETGSSAARPGDGIREYRRLVTDLHKLVAGCVASAEDLAKASASKAPTAQARFDESVHRLEVASVSARARVEAMEKRGEAYFEECAEEHSCVSAADNERIAGLRLHFNAILSDTRQVRPAFRQFIDALRGVRGKLGPSSAAATIESIRPALLEIATEGYQVEAALDRLIQTLNTAESAVMTAAKQSPRNGGKP